MTPATTVNLLSALFVIFSAFGGSVAADALGYPPMSGVALGFVFGLVLVLIDRLLKGFTLRAFSSATFGLLLGFIFATLLKASGILRYQGDTVEWIVTLFVYATFGYLGMMLAMRSSRDEFSLVIPYVRFSREAVQDVPVLLDPSVLIDARVIELCKTGFLSHSLIIARFVTDEIQRLADSSEPVTRDRGRRALDNLEKLRNEPGIEIIHHDGDPGDSMIGNGGSAEKSIDQRMIHLAQILKARLVTCSPELAKTAQLHRVKTLDLKELEALLRPVVTSGDTVELHLVRGGKEAHQAVGYLPDGTMIVVNQARKHLGETVFVAVGSAVQTSAGRLYFGELIAEAAPA